MADSTQPKVQKASVDLEEDLDDLDDVLDQFSPENSKAKLEPTSGRPRTNTRVDAPPISLPGSGPPLSTTAEVDDDELAAEFAKELAKGMESLMLEIAGEAGVSAPEGGDAPNDEQARAFKAAWEAMLVEGMNGKGGDEALPSLGELLGDKGLGKDAPKPSSSASSSNKAGGASSDSDFQKKIKEAMEKLKEGENGAADDASPESIEALLKSLKDLGMGDGEGGEGDAELAGFLENMMGQLMSKEILYEPLKELADGFPPYLAKPPQPLSDSDRARYEKQLVCVRRIIEAFDAPSYSDTNPDSVKTIVELMSEMQSHGSPPSELMGPLPPGFDGIMPNLDDTENCTIA